MKPFRLAVVNSHPIQYFAPLYAFLTRRGRIEVTALYGSDASLRGSEDPGFRQRISWDIDLLAGYRSVFLGGERSRTRTPGGFWSIIAPEVWREIRSDRPDAVLVHGYNIAVNLVAVAAAWASGIPVLMRSETHLVLRRGGWRRQLRDSFLRLAYRGVAGFLAIGSLNREYYLSLGVPDNKIFHVPYTVDNDRFSTAADAARQRRAEVRARFGLPVEGRIVLYASKLMPRKHPEDVVLAVASLVTEMPDVVLWMVGAGQMDQELRELAAASGIPDRTVFSGFINQSQLPEVFAASDVFVFPSENEPWGLIVNEAMCAGLPIISTPKVGAVTDLVRDGENGKVVPVGDVPALTAAVREILSDDGIRQSMGATSRRIIATWSYSECEAGLTAFFQGRLAHSGQAP